MRLTDSVGLGGLPLEYAALPWGEVWRPNPVLQTAAYDLLPRPLPIASHASQGACHEPRRPHREAPRHQAREGLDLEAYLRADRRHVADADHRRAARADEADQNASRQGGRA